jgi:transposase
MSRHFARSPRGERAYVTEKTQKGPNVSVIGVLGLEGIVAWKDIEGPVNTENFLQFVKEELLETLRRGDVLVMDNLWAHKDPEVLAVLEAHGIRVLHLPPYHPQFNPIEHFWARFKAFLRKTKARTKLALRVAIDDTFELLGPDNALEMFQACGYSLSRIR